MNAEISKTIRATLLRFGVQIPELLPQRATPTITPTNRIKNWDLYSVDDRIKILTEAYCSYQYLSIDPKKSLPRPLKRPQTSKNRKYERGYLGNYQR